MIASGRMPSDSGKPWAKRGGTGCGANTLASKRGAIRRASTGEIWVDHVDYAVVVDEYGGVAGYVDLEDIAEQLLGPMEDDVQNDPIEQIGPLQYRLHANLSITDWGDAFGIEIAEGRLTTIGGFVTALLEKEYFKDPNGKSKD